MIPHMYAMLSRAQRAVWGEVITTAKNYLPLIDLVPRKSKGGRGTRSPAESN
jgi:gamma-glutamylcyclotransferase (GGCT)/AIG2-like uncharacterized protein YtfP